AYTGGQARRYGDYQALLADPAVEAVDICLPHHLHAPAILAAAGAGKAMLCEKPLCMSLAEAGEIGAALDETGVPFVMAHNQLFQPSLIDARRRLEAGDLGRLAYVRSIEASQQRGPSTGELPAGLAPGESPWDWRKDTARMGGGEVFDTGWHGIYRLLALMDDRPVAVSATLGRFLHHGMTAEDTGAVTVRFASGTIGDVLTSWAFGLPGDRQFEIAGEHASLTGSPTASIFQPHGEPATETRHEPVHTWSAGIGHFLAVVQHGVPNQATFTDGARTLQVITAAYLAAEQSRAVALPEDPLVAPA
ncbi:MAG: Gfo/Idh/MocA family oxidoreductase, partial [Chloroflexia bacterium]|nr:Gfo/Idh/MocA family oxidoreductase [Chloroflexia bacterium]